MIDLGPRPKPKCHWVSLPTPPPPPPISTLSTAIATYSLSMSMGIGRHYIIRCDITTKLYIVQYGYVIEVIVKYCDNTCTSKTELDTAGQKCVKQRCMQIFFLMNYMPMGISRHYIIRRDITTKLYILHYGYIVQVNIVQIHEKLSHIEPAKNVSNNDILIKWSGKLY